MTTFDEFKASPDARAIVMYEGVSMSMAKPVLVEGSPIPDCDYLIYEYGGDLYAFLAAYSDQHTFLIRNISREQAASIQRLGFKYQGRLCDRTVIKRIPL